MVSKRTRVTRVPNELMEEAKLIKKQNNLGTNSEAIRRIVAYSQLGREIVHRDMLTANARIFNLKIGRDKLKIRKPRSPWGSKK